MRVKLYRIGSDPEWVFVDTREWGMQIVPASQIITDNRALGLSAFIGTDGHQAIAEMRPEPSYNVRRHVYDIAFALVSTHDFLLENKRLSHLRLAALPFVGGEPLGGHLHVTLFVEDPTMAWLQQNNWTYASSFTAWNPNIPTVPLTDRTPFQRHIDDVQQGRTVSTNWFQNVCNYLIAPFEYWIQPWHARIQRNRRYGINDDVVRVSYTAPPANMTKFSRWAFVHYEYRLPSTWLLHPYIAYVYLALFKFSMLNWHRIMSVERVRKGELTDNKAHSAEPANEYFWQSFKDRLMTLHDSGNLRISNDLRDLRPTIDLIRAHRNEWFNPYGGVVIDAWRKLLAV